MADTEPSTPPREVLEDERAHLRAQLEELGVSEEVRATEGLTLANGDALAADVVVDAYCRVGPHVKLGPGTRLHHGAVVDGWTTIGARNQIHSYA